MPELAPAEPVDLVVESGIARIECWLLDNGVPDGLASRVGRIFRGAVAFGVLGRGEFYEQVDEMWAP